MGFPVGRRLSGMAHRVLRYLHEIQCGILISQYWGKRDLKSISRAIGVASFLGVALALVVAVVLFLWPVQIMDLMSNKHHLSLLGAPYLRVIGFSYVFNMLSSIYVSAQRLSLIHILSKGS